MPQASPITIDSDVYQSLRELLGDTDPAAPLFTEARLTDALRDGRRTVLYRDPAYCGSGVFAFFGATLPRRTVPIPETDLAASTLRAEPGLRSFQAQAPYRHWDSSLLATIWRSGEMQTLTTDYTLNYAEGRVTFVSDIPDYEPVNASFCYYPIYRIAKSLLLAKLAAEKQIDGERHDTDSYTYEQVETRIRAIDEVLADVSPRNVAVVRRLY
jgi:hypothetical protein